MSGERNWPRGAPGRVSVPYECFDGGIAVNLPSWVLAGLACDDAADDDDLAWLWKPGRKNLHAYLATMTIREES